MRLLVFDDDDAMGRLVVKIATLTGMEATAVTTAEAFAERMQSDPPEVIVLDLQLGLTDGVEQMRLLAGWRFAGALVLMSGYDARVLSTARTVGNSLGLKVEAVLGKPLRVAEVEEVFVRLQSAGQSMSAERLLEAIANDELSLDFQPIVAYETKELKKLEALVRWEHPVLGRIPPSEFLPLAESSVVLVDALTDWVVGAAVDAYQVLTELGISVPLSVNISAQNLHDLTLPDRIALRLQAGGMPTSHLCLELTESAVFKDSARTMDILSRLRLKGMQLSIDDFGTGYSSLKVLRQMPFSEIKIDQSFISDVATSRDSRAIVKSIIDLAADMELVCVAEGVESAEVAILICQLGPCDLQGYHIALPMPIEAVPSWLAIWTRSSAWMPRGQAKMAIDGPAVTQNRDNGPQSSAAALTADPKCGVIYLTPRQLDVMRLLSEGCPLKEIAFRLNLSISTVKVHLALAYSALGSHNRIEAIRRAAPTLLCHT
jgi:EAL domain-containing protein (putative c-di-GMP-specific phosphodiesterase class I)/DNA-binding CsgD family transcriptional regulator